MGIAFLILLRVVVDRLVLPGDTLDGEMQQQNWGAALIEGAAASGVISNPNPDPDADADPTPNLTYPHPYP